MPKWLVTALGLVVAVAAPMAIGAYAEARQGRAATINLDYAGPGPLHAPKIVNGVEYQYDANGNLLDDGERTIEWNLENKPESVSQRVNASVIQLVYDGDGRRIIKSVKESECQSVNDQCQNAKLVYVNNNLTIKQFNNETISEYYYPLPPATAIRDSDSNTIRYLHPDHLGSTRLVTNQEGQTRSSIDYFPYGERVNESVSQRVNESRYLYTGQELDAESGLYNLNARLYNPATAHFISADPIKSGYNYGDLNPLLYRDTTGLQEEHHTYILTIIANYPEYRSYIYDPYLFTPEEREYFLSHSPAMQPKEFFERFGMPPPETGRLYISGPESLTSSVFEELEKIRESDPDLYYQIGTRYQAIIPLGSLEQKVLSFLGKDFVAVNKTLYVSSPQVLKSLPLDGSGEYTIDIKKALSGRKDLLGEEFSDKFLRMFNLGKRKVSEWEWHPPGYFRDMGGEEIPWWEEIMYPAGDY